MSDIGQSGGTGQASRAGPARHANAPQPLPSSDPIKHVVLLLMENHSFDQMLGCMDEVYPDLDGVRSASAVNEDGQGHSFRPRPTRERQMRLDPRHDHADVMAQLEQGNTGFVRTFVDAYPRSSLAARQDIMGYYPLDFLPALHRLARCFTVCDRWFASLPGPTWPNRFFALSGTSLGEVGMPAGLDTLNPHWYESQTQDTIFDRLDEAGKRWKVYFYDFPASLLFTHQRRAANLAGYRHFDQFFEDAAGPEHEFPEFVLIEPKYFGAAQNDDHPPHNVMKAEKLIADTYNALRANPALWQSTLLVILYDEHGGFYDHAVPPSDVAAPDNHIGVFAFNQLGVRVPALLVSPWCDAGVHRTQFDHTSLLKYLCDKWQLAPLGRRVASAASIAAAIRRHGAARDDTPRFIRVANALLIPDDAELESDAINTNQSGLHGFADFLHAQLDQLVSEAVGDAAGLAGNLTGNFDANLTGGLTGNLSADSNRKAASKVSAWASFKHAAGGACVRLGRWLSQDYRQACREREARTSQAVERLQQRSGVPQPPRDAAAPPGRQP